MALSAAFSRTAAYRLSTSSGLAESLAAMSPALRQSIILSITASISLCGNFVSSKNFWAISAPLPDFQSAGPGSMPAQFILYFRFSDRDQYLIAVTELQAGKTLLRRIFLDDDLAHVPCRYA